MRSWRKVGCYLEGGGSGLSNLPKMPRDPLAPNDDGHCPRDPGTQVDGFPCVRAACWAEFGRGELSTPPDQMYSLTHLVLRLSAPSLVRDFLGKAS